MTRALAVGEFLCPGCGGVANMIIQEQEQPHAPFAADPADQSPIPTWWAPWQAWATVELICQGPGYDPGFEGYDEDAAAAAVAELPPGHTAAEALAAVMNATYRPGENDTDNDDDDESDSAWDHAGTSIDLVATRYQPISLN